MSWRESNMRAVFVKYFKHGIVFSILMSGYLLFAPLVEWVVAYDPRPLTFEPLLVLFLIVYIFIGLFFLIGGIESSISKHLWNINPPQTWQDLLGTGVVLFTLLCLVQIPAALVTTFLAWMQPDGLFLSFEYALLPIFLPSVLITPIPNGVVCKHIALKRFKDVEANE
jgi:hypothetical protein